MRTRFAIDENWTEKGVKIGVGSSLDPTPEMAWQVDVEEMTMKWTSMMRQLVGVAFCALAVRLASDQMSESPLMVNLDKVEE